MTKLLKKIIYNGTITLKTGLHIGGANTALNIGGPDNFVVRNPLNKKPYIPGSSLKGKLRSLLELKYGEITVDEKGNAKACEDPETASAKLFGIAANKGGHASRLIVRDCELIIDNLDEFKNTDLLYTESKTEANIDRVTSAANPRTYERVPAGAKFELNMVLNIFDTDTNKGEDLKKYLKEAVELLEDDYLGGSGSRGYGQVVLKYDTEEKTYND